MEMGKGEINFETIGKAKKGIFTFFGFSPLKYRFLGFFSKKCQFWIFCSKGR
jgi:hypothetical protein